MMGAMKLQCGDDDVLTPKDDDVKVVGWHGKSFIFIQSWQTRFMQLK